MSKARIVVLGTLAAVVAAGAWSGWRAWREWQLAPVVRAAVPAIPNLAAWPTEYAARVRLATAAASRLEQPLQALGELACLYHANAFYREALQVETRLHALEPGNAQWSYYLADSCRNLGDPEAAQFYYERTLQLAPYYAPTRLKLADLLFKQGRNDEAFTHYERRLSLVPRDPYARLGLARIALQRGDQTGALKHLEAITRDNPDFPSAHNLLAEIYGHRGDTARADEERRLSGSTGELREADDPWLSRMYAWSFDSYRLEVMGGRRLQAQQLQAVLPFYEKAVHLAPGDGSAYDALGNVYLLLLRPVDAQAAFEAGLAAAPQTPALYVSLARALQTQKRMPEARQTLQRGLDVARRSGNAGAVDSFTQLLGQLPP